MLMGSLTKEISIFEAKNLIHELIDGSDIDLIENFWLVELSKLSLSERDARSYNKIVRFKNESSTSESSKKIYNNIIKFKILTKLLKKNWRRFLNNNVIEKYNFYTENREELINSKNLI